jgi:hypothetical protein
MFLSPLVRETACSTHLRCESEACGRCDVVTSSGATFHVGSLLRVVPVVPRETEGQRLDRGGGCGRALPAPWTMTFHLRCRLSGPRASAAPVTLRVRPWDERRRRMREVSPHMRRSGICWSPAPERSFGGSGFVSGQRTYSAVPSSAGGFGGFPASPVRVGLPLQRRSHRTLSRPKRTTRKLPARFDGVGATTTSFAYTCEGPRPTAEA